MLKKAMIYLGLGPDEHYEGYEDPVRSQQVPNAAPSRYPSGVDIAPGSGVTVDPSMTGDTSALGRTVRPVSLAPASEDVGASSYGDDDVKVVHSLPSRKPTNPMKPHAVTPAAFNDAQEIGDRFKSGQPVIVNLQALDRDLRRRLVDFASGLCYAIGGKMDRVADQVYLLTPEDAESQRGGRRHRP